MTAFQIITPALTLEVYGSTWQEAVARANAQLTRLGLPTVTFN